MQQLNENLMIASGKEMHEAGHIPANNDRTEYLWLKYNWHLNKESELTFAPYCNISLTADDNSTHLVAEKYYCHFPKNEKGHFMFVDLMGKYVDIKELAPQII